MTQLYACTAGKYVSNTMAKNALANWLKINVDKKVHYIYVSGRSTLGYRQIYILEVFDKTSITEEAKMMTGYNSGYTAFNTIEEGIKVLQAKLENLKEWSVDGVPFKSSNEVLLHLSLIHP